MSYNQQNALILAGVRKCGTTTLFDMLARHSLIAPATAKESQYFACDPATAEANLDWYASLFGTNTDAKTWLDGSTWYFGISETPDLVKRCLPQARVVVCLRDPAKRAFSGYLHMKKQTPTKEQRDFEVYLSKIEEAVTAGASIWEAEETRLEQAVREGLTDADYIGTDFHAKRFGVNFPTHMADRRFSFRYLSESCYSHWLEKWEVCFGERLKIVLFEDLLDRPDEVIPEVLDFIGLRPEVGVDALVQQNETKQPSGRIASTLLALRRHSRFGKFAGDVLKSLGLKRLGAGIRENHLYGAKERLSPEQESRLRRLLAPEYAYWMDRRPETKRLWPEPYLHHTQ